MKLLPNNPLISGVKNENGWLRLTVTALPDPVPPDALAQEIVVPLGSLHVTTGAAIEPASVFWPWLLVSSPTTLWIPAESVGFEAAYAAPSRAALSSSIFVKKSRPTSIAATRSSRKTGNRMVNSTSLPTALRGVPGIGSLGQASERRDAGE